MSIVALILFLALCTVGWLWWLSINQMNGMTNFHLLTLLNEENYYKHRGSLFSLTRELEAKNAIDLFAKITLMVRKLVGHADRQRMTDAVTTELWECRNSADTAFARTP